MSEDNASLSRPVRIRRWALDRLGPLGSAIRAARRRYRQLGPATGVVDELRADINRLAQEQHRTGALIDQVRADVHSLAQLTEAFGQSSRESADTLTEIERRVRGTQALTARVYEQAHGWERRLHEARLAESYELAYDGNPLITVRTPTYNRAELLCERALASLRRQTYTHWEAIVIGDACTDDTEDRVNALRDPRIRFENLPFRGPYPDDERELWMVAGLQPTLRAEALARGQWIAQLDDDDEWDDDHLEVLLAEARRTHAEVVYAGWRLRDASNGRLLRTEGGEWPPRLGGFAFQCALYHHCLRTLQIDETTRFAGEPGDWNRARRLWDAGARFAFVDRPVATIWFTPRYPEARQWFEAFKENGGYAGSPSPPGQ